MRMVVSIHGGGEFIGLSEEDFIDELARRDVSLERIRQKHSWKGGLEKALGSEYDVLAPHMPRKDTPHYTEWKLWFEKIIPLLDDSVLLLGHSLGGLFLIKYLAEARLDKRVAGLFVVAAPYAALGEAPWEAAGFALPPDLSGVPKQAEHIFLYHSTDDRVVPPDALAQYREKFPAAAVRTFDDRGHFNGESFPEIIEDIRSLT